MSNPPVLSFGKFRGWSLTAIPKEYLEFLASAKAVTQYGILVYWQDHAKMEIARRAKGGLLDSPPDPVVPNIGGVNYDTGEVNLDSWTGINLPIESEELPSLLDAINTKQVDTVLNSSVDQISKLLLKEFILRKEKNLGIMEWSKVLAGEAQQYGTLFGTSEATDNQTALSRKEVSWIRRYLGVEFRYHAERSKVMAKVIITLREVWPIESK